jgi:hypothetical protein
MGMKFSEGKRPSLRTVPTLLIVVTAVLAAAVLDRLLHQGVIAATTAFLIALTYVAWYFLRYWHSMGWLSLPKRKRSY